MPFLTESEARNNADDKDLAPIFLGVNGLKNVLVSDEFDIFLSHSIKDATIVLGVKRALEATGKRVYVDWVHDKDYDRAAVDGDTAEQLRKRMRQCASLIYIYSKHSQRSRWMPWELGYFDGLNGNVAVFPIRPDHGELDFDGEEYLQIYPKVEIALRPGGPELRVTKAVRLENADSLSFDEWKHSADKLRPRGP
ncbi:toll/interleukin-1 receptor domain-containing protein (plasmid) [Sinorhizobium meliloti]|uniref:toll/interleukin-1 receptor domain-containing protein n=1 Tax=Rhizobium meliloti TaxID=382 RepID=UPI000B49E12A|nr:toll/interleukin-1 receptor domain-containing protein [Sinorhizobium meliloti]ASP76506.1 toll/interleukin-1 receptor domain-containing protein [Sinorhizobium meliloti]MDE3856997.1 toll/interleukin-1 receptor domain-containing protein [Sinorhizobium meliloti]MQW47903.1 TIR domain-containing protein [Sinorhizobium meliloti]